MQEPLKEGAWGTPIINLENENCLEKKYAGNEIMDIFLDAMKDLLVIFDEYNKEYDDMALKQEEEANRIEEANFYLRLYDISKVIRNVL